MSLKGTAMTDKVLRGKIKDIHQIEDVNALYAEAEEMLEREAEATKAATAAAEEAENNTIISAKITDGGYLLLRCKNEKTFSVGNVIGPKGEEGDKGDKGDKGEKGDPGEVTLAYANQSFANALKGSASGSSVSMKDVSPLPHNIGVKLTCDEFLKYDYNEDGVFDANDAGYLVLHTSYPSENPIPEGKAADVNGDGVVDMDDAVALLAITNSTCERLLLICQAGDATLDFYEPVEISYGRFVVRSKGEDSISFDGGNLHNFGTFGELDSIDDINVGDIIYIEREDDTNWTVYLVKPDFTSVTLKKYGKNLFNPEVATGTACFSFEENGEKVFTNAKHNDPTFSQREYVGIDVSEIWEVANKLKSKVTISFDIKSAVEGQMQTYTLGKRSFSHSSANKRTFTSTAEWQRYSWVGYPNYNETSAAQDNCILSFYGEYGTGVVPYVKNIQIELGGVETELCQFQSEICKPNADGTVDGVTSLYPTTTLLTDNADVTITAEYNRDLNKAFAEIYQAIATMGAAAVTIPEEV